MARNKPDEKPPVNASQTVPTDLLAATVVAAQSTADFDKTKQWLIDNNTPGIAAFPELGAQAAATIAPYTQNVAVTFKDLAMYTQFTANLSQLAELCEWSGERGGRGIFLKEV